MNPESTSLQAPKVIRLNGSLYQLYRLAGTRSILVVFFHGFQLEDYANAHWKTWTSGDGSVWPQTWLVEEFPKAHVLSVSYNQWLENDRRGGTMEVYNICENLRTDLLNTYGEGPRCPIILVSHSFGGLLVKELCVHVSNRIGREPDLSTKSNLEDFLKDVKGIFFYGTPHHGIREEALAAFTAENQSLREYVRTLSTPAARTEFDFSSLSKVYKWEIGGLGESHPIEESGFSNLGVGVENVGVVSPEATSRYGSTYNTADGTDHITITRPKATTERSFTALMRLLRQIDAKGVDVERPIHQSQGIPEYHAGLRSRSDHVVEKLKNARILGIVGMGGIGKTTIAKAVFNKISEEFEFTCFLDNVKGIEIRQLEHQVLSDFYHRGMPLDLKDAHWSTLKGKKTLIVMDDVNSKEQLKKLPKPSDFGDGSRLIITSRDSSILKSYEVHEVDFLTDSEAKDLFCQNAFGLHKVPEGNQQLEADIKKVLKKCQGLPLTLELVGSYLNGHDGEVEFWNETIVKLGNVQGITGDRENTLGASLNMSYESLGRVEREIFLEAATCFFEQPLEQALAVWKTDHGSSITSWGNLLSKSMVKPVRKIKWKFDDSFGAFRRIEYMEVGVHEHFRDWATLQCTSGMVIGVDEDAQRAIDLLKDDEDEHLGKAGTTKTLRLCDQNQQTKLQLNLLDKVEHLKYLELEGIFHEGSIKTCPRLSILRWSYYHDLENDDKMNYQVLPLNVNQMKNLTILELRRMRIPEEFPEALENLVNLRILSLSHLEGLNHLPERFGNLSSLQQLELEDLRISKLPGSFCKLSTLTDLSIVGCSSLQTLPDSFGKLCGLKYMWIAKCSILERLPDSFGDLKLLKDLCISGCRTLEVQPENFQSLSSLERLQLDSCSQSTRLPNLGELKSLLFVMLDGDSLNLSMPPKKLKLSSRTPEKLSAILGVLSAVEDLEVDSSGLRRLPGNLSSLSTLKRLTLRCGGLQELPENFGNLPALTDLKLECQSLERLPGNLSSLSTLKRLTLRCEGLEELPENFGNVPALTDLKLECQSLERLPESFKGLSSLERLEINGCAKLRGLPNVGELTALQRLTIDGQVFEQFSAILILTVTGQTLEKLSASFGFLSALKVLDVFDHSAFKLKRLPENLGTLSTLERLTIRCADLEELPENFGNLSELKDLTLECPSLQRLPASFKQLSSLERLVMGGNVELPNVGELTSLVMLTIDGRVFDDLSATKKDQLSGHTPEKSELEREMAVSIEHALQAPEVIKLNDSVYQLYRPAGTRSMLVVFFHGFQLEDYENAHTKTWTAGDGSVWPQTWLVDEFPEAHVLSISYNRWVTKDRDRRTMNVFNICENLMTDLLSANAGPRCPIILVGHSFGGLVIKQLCVHLSNRLGCEGSSITQSSLEEFLKDLKGMFFYGTHRGIRKEALAASTAEHQPLLEYVKALSTPAASEVDFFRLSEVYKWQIVGLGESHPIKKSGFPDLVIGLEDLGVVAPKASSRYGWRYKTAENTDHITIARPKAKTGRNFAALMGLLSEINPKGVKVERRVHQSPGIPEYQAGLGRKSHNVIQNLGNMNVSERRVLGIVGMAGIGKTTIAKAVFNKISKEFQYTCFLDNVKGIEIRQLEHQVLSKFYHHGMPLEQKDAHWSTVKGEKTLIVMDDVNSEEQLKKLPTPWYFGDGSRFLITSRDRRIFKFYQDYDVYEVDFLRPSEAKELFCQCAFGLPKVPEGNQHLEADVKRALKKCQGLPLTLELVGSYLKGHDGEAEFWDETILKLGNVQGITGDQEKTLWASFKMCYDGLAPVEGEMFLEAATCFFEQPVERALAVWGTDHGNSIAKWESLLSKSMVKQVRKTKWKEGYRVHREIDYMEVWVHDFFRDWAKINSADRMVIGVDEDVHKAIDLLTADEVKAGLRKTLRLRDRNQQTKLPLNMLDTLENLKYLELEGIFHEGSTKKLPRLSILRWNYDHDLRSLKQMKYLDSQVLPLNVNQMNNLAILELSSMKIPEDFPQTLENLVNLRILSLCYLEGLDHLPGKIGNLSSLRQLELEGLGISSLPDSFCKLSTLTDLSIVNCSSLKTLPDSFGKLSHLKYLWIANCSSLVRLPNSFGNLELLKDLCLSFCPILEVLPGNFQCLTSLERLQLDSCSQSSRLPNLGQLKALLCLIIDGDSLKLSMPTEKLKLSGRTLEKLSESFGILSALKDLEVVHSWGVERLPENLATLSTLKRLTIRCADLEELPDNFGNLSALTDLTLQCRSLKRLPGSFKRLSCLERLVIDGCSELELPHVSELRCRLRLTIDEQDLEDFHNLSARRKLTLAGQTLKTLSASVGVLSALEDLEVVKGRRLLERLPENLGTLSSLKRLTILCDDLKALPENFGNLSALTDLTLQQCRSLKRLPESFKQLSCLERLVIDECWQLELPNVSDLACLVRLTIDGEVLEELSAIKRLTLSGETLKKLSASFGVLCALEDLEVVGGWQRSRRLPENVGTLATLQRPGAHLKELSENLGNLSALTDLTLRCPRLKRLLDSCKHLSYLERLVIDGSSGVERLPENLATLSTLKRLTIRCADLEELPENLGNLSALTDLTLQQCRSLKRLPESFKHLSCLERLVIDECWQLELPNVSDLACLVRLTIDGEVLEEFSAIKRLTLSGETLEKLSASFGVLCALEDLEVVGGWQRSRRLPENVGTLATLQRSALGAHLKELSENLGNLFALTDLTLRCPRLKRLPDSCKHLSYLERLAIDGSWGVERLPENLATLSTLKRLTIRCADLEELPENLGNLSALTDLTLQQCRSLKRLPESFKHLSCLERLVIDECWQLELPNVSDLACLVRLTIDGEVLEEFSAIKRLTLSGETLKILSASFGVLCALEDLEVVDGWQRLERLPENLGTLATLQRLAIRCADLKALPENLGNLSALTDLTLRCPRLEGLPESFKRLSCLERLEIDACWELELPNVSELRCLVRLTIDGQVLEDFHNLSARKELTRIAKRQRT